MSEQVNRVVFSEDIHSEKYKYINIEAVPERLWIEQPCISGNDSDIISLTKEETINLINALTRALEMMRPQ